MGYEGANGSTGAPGMTDESSSTHGTATVNGAAQIQTAQFQWGTSSLHTNNVIQTDYISFPDSNDWVLSSANSDQFTIECWIRYNTLSSGGIAGQWSGSTDRSWQFYALNTGQLQFMMSNDGTTQNINMSTTGTAMTTGTWYHIAVDKDATGKIRLYIGGVMRNSFTPANSAAFNSSRPLYIGTAAQVTGDHARDGWTDELRITKGVARYATDTSFTVPTAAFPRG
jgi:hypothetical protein